MEGKPQKRSPSLTKKSFLDSLSGSNKFGERKFSFYGPVCLLISNYPLIILDLEEWGV